MASRPEGPGDRAGRLGALALVLVGALIAAACTGSDGDQPAASSTAPAVTAAPGATDRAYYVLAPGNYGGIPANEHSLDQLPLYDGLTPLRGEITDDEIEALFLPQDLRPIGTTTEEKTGRDGVTILYDSYGIAHVEGETREDLAFGAGWVTARDRQLLLDFGRGPARAAVADIPGLDAFSLVTGARQFVPSAATEELVSAQVELLRSELGAEGERIITDASAYADGVNAYWEEHGIEREPVTVNDVVAVTAFIGSIFGAGGGSEVRNAELLDTLTEALGTQSGRQAWEDLMLIGDPEAPTTLEQTFDYGVITGGEVTGSVTIDAGSVESFDPLGEEGAGVGVGAGAGRDASGFGASPGAGLVDSAAPPPDRQASNWLLVDPSASAQGTSLGVLGPQLGYYYPEIVQQLHLSGPGIEAQGVAVPGLAMYILIGRTPDYAWSLTSAGHDVRDVFAETLCEPDGSEPTRGSDHYLFQGECIPFETFDAGTLDGEPISYQTSVHGPVIGTATSEGRPVALSRKRSTFGRDGLNLVALKRMTEGAASSPEAFFETANQFEFTFNWGWVGRGGIAYFSSGRLPLRAEGLDRRLPADGNGEYEWQGFLSLEDHPHGVAPPAGRLLNWNNQSAPGFMHGDGTSFGSVHRVEMFDEWPERATLADVVGIMNHAATQFPNSQVWPVVSAVLSGGDAPSSLAQALVDQLDGWLAQDAPAVDVDEDELFDDAGPAILEALWKPMVLAAIRPALGDLAEQIYEQRRLADDNGASILDKDLRTLLGREVEGPFNLAYCGAGSLERCRQDLWAAVEQVASELAVEHGSEDPSTWLMKAWRTGFEPGLIPDTFRTTNRPTFQQLMELTPSG